MQCRWENYGQTGQMDGDAMNHEAILAVLPESRDDAKSLKKIPLAMRLGMATYTDWIRVERGSPAHCGPGTDGAYAARIGLHDPVSESLADRFTPQCCRRWLVTHLLRTGMSRDQ